MYFLRGLATLTYHKIQLGKIFMRRTELFSSPSGPGDMRLGYDLSSRLGPIMTAAVLEKKKKGMFTGRLPTLDTPG